MFIACVFMKYDFITIGGATEDITFYTDEGVLIKNKKNVLRQNLLAFEFGAKIKIDKAYSTFGGGASNTAVNFSRLGFKTASLISVGDGERGKKVLENLKNQNVDIAFSKIIKNRETGFSFLLVGPENEHIVFSNRAVNDELKISVFDLRKIKNTEWIYITSLSGEWEDVLKKIFSLKKAKIAWNPGNEQLVAGISVLKKYLKQTSVLCVNKDEAIELVVSDPKYKKKPTKFLNNSRNLQKIIKSWGPEIVVVTKGRQGVDVYDGECFYHQNIIKEKKVEDTTGVGDAFNSSFVAGLEAYQGDIKKAIRLGLRTTASVVAKQGAQNGLLSKKDL